MPKIHIFEENQAVYQNMSEAFRFAERCLKLVEIQNTDDGLDIPSINELRYTAFHLIHALDETEAHEQKEQLRRAKRHCERAAYDAMELGIIRKLEEIRRFQKDYRMTPITNILPDYIQRMEAATAVRDFLAENTDRNKHENYKKCELHYHSLKDIVQKLTTAREELNKSRRNRALAASATLAGLMLAALALNNSN